MMKASFLPLCFLFLSSFLPVLVCVFDKNVGSLSFSTSLLSVEAARSNLFQSMKIKATKKEDEIVNDGTSYTSTSTISTEVEEKSQKSLRSFGSVFRPPAIQKKSIQEDLDDGDEVASHQHQRSSASLFDRKKVGLFKKTSPPAGSSRRLSSPSSSTTSRSTRSSSSPSSSLSLPARKEKKQHPTEVPPAKQANLPVHQATQHLPPRHDIVTEYLSEDEVEDFVSEDQTDEKIDHDITTTTPAPIPSSSVKPAVHRTSSSPSLPLQQPQEEEHHHDEEDQTVDTIVETEDEDEVEHALSVEHHQKLFSPGDDGSPFVPSFSSTGGSTALNVINSSPYLSQTYGDPYASLHHNPHAAGGVYVPSPYSPYINYHYPGYPPVYPSSSSSHHTSSSSKRKDRTSSTTTPSPSSSSVPTAVVSEEEGADEKSGGLRVLEELKENVAVDDENVACDCEDCERRRQERKEGDEEGVPSCQCEKCREQRKRREEEGQDEKIVDRGDGEELGDEEEDEEEEEVVEEGQQEETDGNTEKVATEEEGQQEHTQKNEVVDGEDEEQQPIFFTGDDEEREDTGSSSQLPSKGSEVSPKQSSAYIRGTSSFVSSLFLSFSLASSLIILDFFASF